MGFAPEIFKIFVLIQIMVQFQETHVCGHPPFYDGTDETLPKNMKDSSVLTKIEKVNQEDGATVDKKPLFEADIVLTTSELTEQVDKSKTGSEKGAEVDVEGITNKRKGIRGRRFLWRTKVVPIEALKEVEKTQKNFLAAIKEIQDNSCIRFKLKEPDDKYWIRLVKKNGCWSPVGRQYQYPGKPQELSIGEGCNYKGIILHELMHALGFWHEQSRTDRDKFIEVVWKNVEKGQQHNFNMYKAGDMDFVGGMYDFNSVMHYGNYAFSKNAKPTMLAIKDPASLFGGKMKLSPTDIMQLNNLYDCKTKDSGWSSWTKWGPCDQKCTRIRQRFCTDKDASNCPEADSTGIHEENSRCDKDECNTIVHGNWGRWAAWSACSVTCGKGYRTSSRLCDNPPPGRGGNICEGFLVMVKECEKDPCSGRSRRRRSLAPLNSVEDKSRDHRTDDDRGDRDKWPLYWF